MNVSKRTRLSLSQFLDLFGSDTSNLLLEKHNISSEDDYENKVSVKQSILQADSKSIASLLEEIAKTEGDLRNRVSPRYRFDERWDELKGCLLLDGFKVERKTINSVEPSIEGTGSIEDDLTKEIGLSHLPESEDIINHINYSAQAFLKTEPDYNGCLSHARIALETLVRGIAKDKGFQLSDEKKAWGASLNHLKTISFINDKQEKTIQSIYTFVSDGSHVPLGFTEKEYTRFGRNLITSICYFISKLLTAG